jgi:glycosyltransferase involved in cell wall biosynthesis
LADAVMPLVWRERPRAQLWIAGRELEPWLPGDPRIVAHGFVEDLAPLYDAADCVMVPLLEGAGSPLKFVEALAYGVPVVATPVAARGLEVQAGVHYAEGADAAGLAAAALAVLADGGAALAAAGRELTEREYSIESLAERIAA